MAAVVPFVPLVVGAIGAYDSLRSGSTNNVNYQMQAIGSERQALQDRMNQSEIRLQTAQELENTARDKAHFKSKQIANLAQSGTLESVSGRQVLAQTDNLYNKDVDSIKHNGSIRAYNALLSEESNLLNAQTQKINAKSTKKGSTIGAIGSIITGVAGASEKYSQLKDRSK